jgi:hypothetical protein
MMTKRAKAVATTLFLMGGIYLFPEWWWLTTVVSLIGVYWFLDFDLKLPEFLAFLYIPLLCAIVIYFADQEVIGWLKVFLYVAGGVGYYILLLALNIVNVATVRTVPLKRAAHSTLYSIGLMLFFIAGLRLAHWGWGAYEYLFAYWVGLSLFALMYLKLIFNRFYWIETSVFAFISVQIVVLISFWPSAQWVSVAAVVGWSFIYLGLIQHVVDKSLNNSILREYSIFGLLLFLALLFI